MVKVSEHTNKNDAASASLCKPGGQFEDASNCLVGLPIILALDVAGLDGQKESVHVLGDGLPASALLALRQRLINKAILQDESSSMAGCQVSSKGHRDCTGRS